jgi:mono/diheme cytochrome c family protein
MRSIGKFSPGRWFAWLGVALLVLLAPAILASGQGLSQTAAEGQTIFKQNCSACHTIGGGRLIGPDLQDVTQRRDVDWLQRMISGPDKMIASQDPTVISLLADYNNLQMPNLGLDQTQVQAVIAYLENPGAVGQGQPASLPSTGAPQNGRRLFLGSVPLANGGPNCIACHTTADSPAIGGGSLGPDLTQVALRLGDQGLASALQTLPFPTMQGVFARRLLTASEQADLYAYFQSLKATPPALPNQNLWFWGAGIAGAVILFGLLSFYWPRQRRSLAERLREEAG